MLSPKHFALLLAGFSMTAQSAESAPKKVTADKLAQPKIAFLEYLGTVESDDENWTDIEIVDEKAHSANGTEPQPKANAKVETTKPVVERK